MTDKWVTRPTLLQRAKDPSNEEAWTEFTDYYSSFIRNVLHKLTFHTSDYDDLTQEILVSIWKSLASFTPDSEKAKFRSWLYSVIRHKVLDHQRKTIRYTQRSQTAGELHLENTEYDTELMTVIDHEWKTHLSRTAIANVEPLFSGAAIQTFELSLKGKTPAEIAVELDIKENSVYTLKNRVKERLAQEIDTLRNHWEF